MNKGKYVFSQVMEFVPYYEFMKCVGHYQGHYCVKRFTCWEQFLAMSFGQFAYRESLRDVVICLNAQRAKSYHLGFRTAVTLPTLARANERRDCRIYQDFAQVLIKEARSLYIDDKGFDLDLDGTCYAIDSSTIELCLSVFPWAPFRRAKAAVKLHTLMDLKGNIPTVFHVSDGKTHDLNFLDLLDFEAGAFYIMDRAYLDFERLYAIDQSGAFFVTRAKKNQACRRQYSNPVDKAVGLRCDQTVCLTGPLTPKKYPDSLRRIKYYDKESKNCYIFLTNNFSVDAKTIAELYKHRWQIELFFKWIKGHLKIKSFWGQSANAVKTQICIAICAYLIVAIIKKKLGIDRNLYEMLQILSVSLFNKIPLNTLFSETDLQILDDPSQKQLFLLDN